MFHSRQFLYKCLPIAVLLFVNFVFVSHGYTQPASSSSSSQTKSYLDRSMDTVLESTNEDTSPRFESSLDSSSYSAMSWFLGKVIVVLGIISGIIWLVGKFLKRSGMAGGENEIMGVRSTLPLGNNQYMQIVQVGPQYFMLGVTDSKITMLGELEDADTIQSLRLDQSDNDDDTSSSDNGFQNLMKQFTGAKDHQFQDENNGDYLDQLQQKISQIDSIRDQGKS